jgi:very-short-patch-repair endonuclease
MDYENVTRVPDGHWDNFSNHVAFRDYIASQLNLKTADDWYEVSTAVIRKMGGNGLLNSKYKGQTLAFLKAVFSEQIWYPWLFKNKLNNFWKDIATRKLFLEWLGNKLGWITRQDYYKVTQPIITQNKGAGLLNYYNHSPIQLLTALLSPPEGDDEWYPWLFDGSTPNNYWASHENRCKYAKWLFRHLGFSKIEDWYNISQDTFRENYGSGLILNPRTYNSSHIAFLQDVYPDQVFLPWFFKQTTQGYWKNLENQLFAMQWFGKECDIKTIDDWYNITRDDIRRNKLGGLLSHYYNDSMHRMIIELNPHISFEKSKFNIHKTEAKIIQYLTKLKIHFQSQYKVCPGKKNGWFRIDFYLPDFDICIEIDGAQHFQQVRKWLNPVIQKKRDVFKMHLLKERGLRCIRLIQEEVIQHHESWLDTNVLPLLYTSDNSEPIYITTLPENHNLYDEHKSLFASNAIHIDELYDEGMDIEEIDEESE